MLPYAAVPDTPDKPIDVDNHTDSHVVLSPIDPSASTRTSQLPHTEREDERVATVSRCTGGTEFFSAVVLDLKSERSAEADEWSDIDENILGETMPLRIQKRLMRKATLKHRSVISGPVSPRSTMLYPSRVPSPMLSRNNTTSTTSTATSSLQPHHSISRIFLNGSHVAPSPLPVRPAAARRLARLSSMPLMTNHHVPVVRKLATDDIALPSPTLNMFPHPPPRQAKSETFKGSLPQLPPHDRLASVPSVSGGSVYHLNLGRCGEDGVRPRMSPPGSPSPSLFYAPLSTPSWMDHDPYASRYCPSRQRDLPASPLNPSWAPSKAAQLLGTVDPRPPLKPSESGTAVPQALSGAAKLKEGNFCPLPTQTLVEIERFFGEVPRKAKDRMEIVHLGASNHHVFEVGGQVRYRDERGVMWRDAEEEQEFAWLMSDPSLSTPSPLRCQTLSHHTESLIGPGQLMPAPAPVQTSSPTAYPGIKAMVDLPSEDVSRTVKAAAAHRPRNPSAGSSTGSETSSISSRPRWGRRKEKKAVEVGESFMDLDFGVDRLRNTARPNNSTMMPKILDRREHDYTTQAELLTGRHPHFAAPSSISLKLPLDSVLALRPCSPSSMSSAESKSDGSGSDRSKPASKVRRRPPPLVLKEGRKNPNLSVVSTTPSPTAISRKALDESTDKTTRKGRTKSMGPDTPFVRPRRAPVPALNTVPSLPPLPPVPALPLPRPSQRPSHSVASLSLRPVASSSSTDSTSTHGHRNQAYVQSKAARLMGLDPMEDPTMSDVSLFEPESPVVGRTKFGQEVTGGHGGWIKKMVAGRI